MHICNPSAWAVEAGGLVVQHQPWLYNNLKASLSYPGPCPKTDNMLSLNSGLFLLFHKTERESRFLRVFPCSEEVIIWCAYGFLEQQRKQSVLKDVSERLGWSVEGLLCNHEELSLILGCTCNPSAGEVETGGSLRVTG